MSLQKATTNNAITAICLSSDNSTAQPALRKRLRAMIHAIAKVPIIKGVICQSSSPETISALAPNIPRIKLNAAETSAARKNTQPTITTSHVSGHAMRAG